MRRNAAAVMLFVVALAACSNSSEEPTKIYDGNECTYDLCDGSGVCVITPIQCPEGQQCNPQTGECEQASVCNQSCGWDTNVDGEVNGADLADLLACWGQITGETPVCECIDDSPSGGDGQIRADDLAVMLVVWGTCPD